MSGLHQLAALAEASVHIFDVDHTLTRHSTGRRFALAGYRAGIIPFSYIASLPLFYLRYRLGRLSIEELTGEIKPLTDRTRKEINTIVDTAWSRRIRSDIYPQAARYVQRLRGDGATIVLASTSFDVILRPLAEHLDVDATVSSVLEFENDRATGWIVDGPCYAEEKARRITAYLVEQSIDAGACAFYTDSFHDLPSLEAVGFPVAVHPDAVLRRIAIQRGWPIVRWANITV